MRTIHSARNEFSKIMSKKRFYVALKKNVPSAAVAKIKILDLVLIFLEHPINKLIGPYSVLNLK